MMQRRELFSSLASTFKKQESYFTIRPPYFKDENAFYKECVKCDGKCATFCNEHIIKISKDKTPYLDLSQRGCTFCDECALACEFDVLKVEYRGNIKAKIIIDMLKCLSWQKTMCFSCKDVCDENAIKFLGLFRPNIVDDICSSCGFCIGVCPTNAIKVEKWQ